MSDIYDKISQLKDLLKHEDNFQSIMDYYFDHIGNNAVLGQVSEQLSSHPTIPLMLKKAGESLLERIKPGKTAMEIGWLGIMKVNNSFFYHGFLQMGDGLGGYFFYEDINSGMLSMSGLGEKVWYTKIKAIPFPVQEPSDPSLN